MDRSVGAAGATPSSSIPSTRMGSWKYSAWMKVEDRPANMRDQGRGAESWRALEDLSTGQTATAVLLLLLLLLVLLLLLLLLLLESALLIVDQPEDELDNRFIADGLAPWMRADWRSALTRAPTPRSSPTSRHSASSARAVNSPPPLGYGSTDGPGCNLRLSMMRPSLSTAAVRGLPTAIVAVITS